MNEKEYQKNELKRFYASKDNFFDSVKEFSDNLEKMYIIEQIDWVENGSYGVGACLALQQTINRLTKHMNQNAQIGSVFLHAFYGKRFSQWGKLSPKAQKLFSSAVAQWRKQQHRFAIALIV